LRLSPTAPDPLRDAPLLAAAALLRGGRGNPLLFLEEREDLRIEAGDGGVREAAHAFLRGLAGRGGPAGRFEASVPDPSPRDIAILARAVASGVALRGTAAGSGVRPEATLDPRAAEEVLASLLTAARRAAGAGRASFTARWVAFDQRIWVARPGREVAADVRTGRRVRLEVRVAARQLVGAAVGERALGTGTVEGLDELAREVVERALVRVGARRAPRGKLPVVFAPGTGGILIHELAGHAVEADTVRRSASALGAAKGQVAPRHVRIVDDPRRGRAPWRMDDEGEQARAVVLVRGGRIAGLLHDQRSAAASGALPTGHGRRSSYQEPVRPRMGCTFLAPGNHDAAEALEGVARGVYVRRMESASTDTSTGEMTLRVTDADLVHRGRLDAPLEPFLLTLTMREALSSLEKIASDLAFDTCIGSCMRDGQPLATSVGAPTFRIGLTTVIS